jgi:hypothetical protein
MKEMGKSQIIESNKTISDDRASEEEREREKCFTRWPNHLPCGFFSFHQNPALLWKKFSFVFLFRSFVHSFFLFMIMMMIPPHRKKSTAVRNQSPS